MLVYQIQMKLNNKKIVNYINMIIIIIIYAAYLILKINNIDVIEIK